MSHGNCTKESKSFSKCFLVRYEKKLVETFTDIDIVYGRTRFCARFGKQFGFRWETARMQGSFVSYDVSQDRYRIADGIWSDSGVSYSSEYDPHTHDYTRNPIVRGNFFKTKGEHFAIGSPNARKEFGRVFICYDCFMKFGHRSSSNDLIIEGSDALCERNNILRCYHDGSRFGHAIAAVDIDGDGFDELIIGAPLFSTKVRYKKLKKV